MNFYLLLVADFKRLLRNGWKGKFYVMYILPQLKIMCPGGKFHAHTFGSLLILKKKKSFKKKFKKK